MHWLDFFGAKNKAVSHSTRRLIENNLFAAKMSSLIFMQVDIDDFDARQSSRIFILAHYCIDFLTPKRPDSYSASCYIGIGIFAA